MSSKSKTAITFYAKVADDIEIPVSDCHVAKDVVDDAQDRGDREASYGAFAYWQLLQQYPMYRAFLISHFCQHLGDWFIHIASLLVVQEFSDRGKTIANMSLSVLLPKAIFSQVGGVIADRFDRRVCMILIDFLSGLVVLGYLAAIAYKSLNIMYGVTILRYTLTATYYPISTGIVPLLVPNTHGLQLACNLNTYAWSIASIIGGMVAGATTSQFGFATCYGIDCATFLISAAWMYWGVSGTYNVHLGTQRQEPESELQDFESQRQCIFSTVIDNYVQVARYLWVCGFGLLVFQKCSASLIWGFEDVVGAKFSTVFNDDGSEDENLSSWHMGCLFSVGGAGCIVGPALVTLITDARHPHTLQRACWIAYCLLTLGWFLIFTAQSFPLFLAFSFVRTMGNGIAWVNCTLLLQTLTEPTVLGRVLALEYTLLALVEAASVSISGKLYDAGLSKEEVALCGAVLGVIMVVWWGAYYWIIEGGAANSMFSTPPLEVMEEKAAGPDQLSSCSKGLELDTEVPGIVEA